MRFGLPLTFVKENDVPYLARIHRVEYPSANVVRVIDENGLELMRDTWQRRVQVEREP